MNPYEGLDLPQLLQRMHPLVLPEPVPWFPQTPGWWVVAGWMLAAMAFVCWHFYRIWRRNRYRREALAQLQAIENHFDDDPAGSTQQIAILIKRTALAAYPRTEVAQLFGADWASFLCRSANHDREIVHAAEQLATAAYRADVDGAALFSPARRWIELHRA